MRAPQSIYKLVRFAPGAQGCSRGRWTSWRGAVRERSERAGEAPVSRVGERDWMSEMHPASWSEEDGAEEKYSN
jgi:hypothetical protein